MEAERKAKQQSRGEMRQQKMNKVSVKEERTFKKYLEDFVMKRQE